MESAKNDEAQSCKKMQDIVIRKISKFLLVNLGCASDVGIVSELLVGLCFNFRLFPMRFPDDFPILPAGK